MFQNTVSCPAISSLPTAFIPLFFISSLILLVRRWSLLSLMLE